jgi:hypothetical protein
MPTKSTTMKKHYLVTISNDIENLFGVRFLCSFFHSIEEHQVTLLHICRSDASSMAKTLNQMWQGPSDGIEGQVTVSARRAILKARELLAEHNLATEHMVTKTFNERYGIVKDILDEGGRGLYDAIILGRRASYALQWMFERPADETSMAIINGTHCTTPLWICPEAEPLGQNILVCLDGSNNALRAVDHVGFILGDQQQHGITLFQVTGGDSGTETIFAAAEQALASHGIAAVRIRRKTAWGLSVVSTILGELSKSGYGAVAVGFRGERMEAENGVGVGSTTAKLLGKLEKASLWCCP